jgi:hypothetical protein
MKQPHNFDFDDHLNRILEVRNKEMFFVMSMPKSGSTWLMNLLNGHNDVLCWGEGHLPNHLLPSLDKALAHYEGMIDQWYKQFESMGIDQKPPVLLDTDKQFLYCSAIALLFSRAAGSDKARVLGEKTPDNLYAANQLASLFPKARFIHIIRDGRDAAVSGWNMRKEMNNFRARFKAFDDYASFYAEKWVQGVEMGQKFGQLNPDKYIELKYEALHDSFDSEVAKLLEFLAVDKSPTAIDDCREGGLFMNKTKGRKRGEENKSSFFRKGIVGDWRNEMNDAVLKAFMNKAGSTLEDLGYPN